MTILVPGQLLLVEPVVPQPARCTDAFGLEGYVWGGETVSTESLARLLANRAPRRPGSVVEGWNAVDPDAVYASRYTIRRRVVDVDARLLRKVTADEVAMAGFPEPWPLDALDRYFEEQYPDMHMHGDAWVWLYHLTEDK